VPLIYGRYRKETKNNKEIGWEIFHFDPYGNYLNEPVSNYSPDVMLTLFQKLFFLPSSSEDVFHRSILETSKRHLLLIVMT
jgi:hypothetical protein